MDTLLAGYKQSSLKILSNALKKRGHNVIEMKPNEDVESLLEKTFIPLIIISDYSDEGIALCKKLRQTEEGKRYTLVSVIEKEQVDQIHKLLEAGFDQYIVESLFDDQRLDVRLAFAEKKATDKQKQFKVEEKLRESEARARSILRTTVDAIITINDRGQIRTFNRAAEKLFQYKASEVVGKNVKVLMPQPYRREHDDYIENYHQTGHRKIIGIGRDVTGKRKDGSTFPMYLAVSEVNVNGQRLYTGIIRDVTEQRRLEQEVLRISEHERHRIGQDLHDGLGQMLTGMSMINKNIAKSLRSEDHPLADNVEEITGLIKEADEYARALSRGLIPIEFDNEGLNAALERLMKNAGDLLNIECELHSTENFKFEDHTSMTHLYRIVQESISNAVKHGNASKAVVTIDGNPERLLIKIEDNGTGFPEDWDKHKGLGVRIMQFRARLMGANLEISTSQFGGASVQCIIFPVGSTYTLTD